MKILIDLQGIQNGSRFRGIGRYSKALAKAIIRNRGDHDVELLLNGMFADSLEEVSAEFAELPRHKLHVFQAPGPVNELNDANAWRVRAAELLREKLIQDLAPDVVLVTSLFEGAEDQTVVSVGQLNQSIPTAVVLYDLIPLINSEQFLGWPPAFAWYQRKLDSLKRADLLLGISESASNEALEHLHLDPEHVTTISSAVGSEFTNTNLSVEQARELHARYGIDRSFIMHSSAYEERKNFKGLIRAFSRLDDELRCRHQLVLVCKLKPEQRAELQDVAQKAGLGESELVLTDFVPDADLIGLYSTCTLFVFPSLHEGFGLPALEAMCCGCPVIGSSTSSIPEVIGRSDALFDPNSTQSIADSLERALANPEVLEELKAHATIQSRKFSWDHTGQLCIEGLENLLERCSASNASQATAPTSYQGLIKELAALHASATPSDIDLRSCAMAIARNEQLARQAALRNAPARRLNWRLEGPFDSSYSLALVNRETARALSELSHNVILHSTEGPGDFPANPTFLAANPDLAAMYDRVSEFPHTTVDVVSRNLYPPRVADMQGPINILHQYAWEESGFPQAWVQSFNANLDGIACVSRHVEKILIDNGVTVPLVASGNGVDHWEHIQAEEPPELDGRSFRFLHVSSCFPRKGAELMLKAYGHAFSKKDDVSLVIKTFPNPHNTICKQLADLQAQNPDYPEVHILEMDISDAELKALYEQCDVLVAPSRAEGFGLPMAEAMLSGTPVITTNWGGQLDFCTNENSWLVDYQFARADTHFNLFGSVWAEPDVEKLTDAMRQAFTTPPEKRAAMANLGRTYLLENYRWTHATARSVELVRHLGIDNGETPALRLGWVTSWNTPCGIATYSERLLQAFPQGYTTVLASHEDTTTGTDDSRTVRCWYQGKNNNGLSEVSRLIEERRLNTLVIQFNYGFFDFTELSALINQAVDNGIVVAVMLHSTNDPLGEQSNWVLAELQPAFNRCHRLLVHSVGDLNRLKALSLVDNVAIIPHGVPPYAAQNREWATDDAPVIASYGFCLPHKGLPELVDAVALLKDQGFKVRLNLINARYPRPVSDELIELLKDKINHLGLQQQVELQNDFLSDEESLARLSESDLLVFAYQNTGESSSAAARYGLATGRPVAVTPLSIFDDIENAAFRLNGTSPADIATGIRNCLTQISADTPEAVNVREASSRWREHHAYPQVGSQLHNLLVGLVRQQSKTFD